MWSVYRGGGGNGRIFVFLSVITSTCSVCDYFVFDGDRSGQAEEFDGDEKFLCFTGRLTELSNSELPNSTVIGVVQRLLMNLTSSAWAMMRSQFVEDGGVELFDMRISLFSGGWGFESVFFRILAEQYGGRQGS